MTALNQFIEIIHKNKQGLGTGIYSVCSAHPDVIRAGMQQALADNSILLVESTSNQVDQFGGYTGMTPDGFVVYVENLANKMDFPPTQLLLGGDHLGPNTWQNQRADIAMNNARDLIAAYVKSGYKKIHLDASMHCQDDIGDRSQPLPDEIVCARVADLCLCAENTWYRNFNTACPIVYVIGTEIPVPGGAREMEESLTPTTSQNALNTIETTRKVFVERGLERAWERVIGAVVQPGVEFGDDKVFHYQPSVASELSRVSDNFKNLIFEAHSTDFQSESGLTRMVEDHFGILKVGPWLTFTYREALFALEAIEQEILGSGKIPLSQLKATLESVMLENSVYWQKYYGGDKSTRHLKRKYSFSDRSRYYWPHPKLKESVVRLKHNLDSRGIPLSLISQFLPGQYRELQEGCISNNCDSLILSRIREVLGIYARACKAKL